MLTKGVVSFPITNSWYLPSFYVGNGCTFFEDGNNADAGIDFGGEKGVAVTNYLVDLLANPNFAVDVDGSGIAGIRDGSIKAMFSGSWDYEAVKAQNDTVANTSILQPFIAPMANYWTPSDNFGKSLRNGEVTHDNAADATEAWNKNMNSSVVE